MKCRPKILFGSGDPPPKFKRVQTRHEQAERDSWVCQEVCHASDPSGHDETPAVSHRQCSRSKPMHELDILHAWQVARVCLLTPLLFQKPITLLIYIFSLFLLILRNPSTTANTQSHTSRPADAKEPHRPQEARLVLRPKAGGSHSHLSNKPRKQHRGCRSAVFCFFAIAAGAVGAVGR